MANQDFAIQDNDLVIIDGDFAIATSDVQHIADTINAFPGWWKNYPADGVGVLRYFNGPSSTQAIKKAIRLNLESDGYIVNNPDVSIDANGKLNITPNATI